MRFWRKSVLLKRFFPRKSPLSQAISSRPRTPNRHIRQPSKMGYVPARSTGEPKWEAPHPAAMAAATDSAGTEKGTASPVMIRSRRRLRMKFTRWVMKKLKK